MFSKQQLRVLTSIVLVVMGLVYCGVAADTSKYGGVYKVACSTEIPTIDCMMTSADIATDVGGNILETLVQYLTADNTTAPELADSWEYTDGGKTLTFKLREGIKFHDGSDFTAEDALASVNRWLQHGGRGGICRPYVENLTAPDDYTLVIHLNQSYAPLLSLLGFPNGGPVIYPAELCNKYPEEMIPSEEIVGTGPYKFEKMVQGEYVRLERWDGYVPRSEPANGRAGGKITYFDNVEFYIVPELQARITGVQLGEFHYGFGLKTDLYDSVNADPDIEVVKLEPTYWCQIFLNTKQGLCADQKMRQAILACLDMDEILTAAFGDLCNVQGSIFPDVTPWYSTSGLEKYNQKNPELGWQLAQEAGYDGEPIRMLVGNMWPQYDLSQVVAKQLKDAGFMLNFQVYDWAGVMNNRRQEDKWEFFVTSGSAVYYDPAISYWLSPTYPGWWDTDEKNAILKEFVTYTDYEDRLESWNRFQALFYEQVPIIKFGDYYQLHMRVPDSIVGGFGTATHPIQTFPYLWNMWFK